MNNANFGRYMIIRLIESGGMADVYKAIMTGPHNFEKPVALKMMHKHLVHDDAFVKMFIDEARLCARLNNPNIVQVIDFGENEKRLYLVMEYISGVNLSTFIKTLLKHNYKPDVVLSSYITAEILKALSYAHTLYDPCGKSLGIVHRDITPQNILLSYDGDVKLTDFGIAKTRCSMTTTAGTLKGKIRYMSPEQASGQTIDNRSDIYSAGLVLYELLTFEHAFSGDTDMSLLKNVRESKIVNRPTELNPAIPVELEASMLNALSLNPSDRFNNADLFKQKLEPYVNNPSLTKIALSDILKFLFYDTIKDELHEGKVLAAKNPHKGKLQKKRIIMSIGIGIMGLCLVIFVTLMSLTAKHSSGTQALKPAYAKPVHPALKIIPRPAHQISSGNKRVPEHDTPVVMEKALIVINASPWADIYISDKNTRKFIGTTPIKHLRLKPGNYTIFFKNKLYDSKTINVKLSPGEKRTVVLRYDRGNKKFFKFINSKNTEM